MFTLDNGEFPFGPVVVWHDRRSFIVDDLTDEQLNVLVEIAPEVKDPEMRARIADVLWIRARNFRMAGLAVDSYLESAAKLEDPENWVQCARRIERALQLAAALGKNNHYFRKTLQDIEHLLDRYRGEDPVFLSAEMMELYSNKDKANRRNMPDMPRKLRNEQNRRTIGIKPEHTGKYGDDGLLSVEMPMDNMRV